jgi:hypothetical protein
VKSLDFEDYPFEVQKFDKPCACAAQSMSISTRSFSMTRAGACSSARTAIIAKNGAGRRPCRTDGCKPGGPAGSVDTAQRRGGVPMNVCRADDPLLQVHNVTRSTATASDVPTSPSIFGPAKCWPLSAKAVQARPPFSTACRRACTDCGYAIEYRMRDGSMRNLYQIRSRAPLADAHRLGICASECRSTACA